METYTAETTANKTTDSNTRTEGAVRLSPLPPTAV